MPPNCPWTAPSRATIVSRGGRTPPGAERSASVRVACEFFLPIGTPSTNGVGRWIEGRARLGKPDIDELRHTLPCEAVFLAAPPERSSPEVGHVVPER